MSFNVILSPTALTTSGTILPLDAPAITTLADGDFAVSYSYFDTLTASVDFVVSVFDAQGQPVDSADILLPTATTPLVYSDLVATDGGLALTWLGGVIDPEIDTTTYDLQTHQFSTILDASNNVGVIEENATATALSTGFAVTWEGYDATSSYRDIYLAYFNAQGQEVVAPINVTQSDNIDDAVGPAWAETTTAELSNGNIALTWTSGPTSSIVTDIYTAVYDDAGNLVAGPTNVSNTGASNAKPEIAALSTGGYALTWSDEAAGVYHVYTAVYDGNGSEAVAPQTVTTGASHPKIAALAGGAYALAWDNFADVFTAVYDSQGQLLSTPVNVTNSVGSGTVADIVTLSNGAYALIWEGEEGDGGNDIFTAVFDAQGQEVVAPVDVSLSAGVDDVYGRATALADGSYAIVWNAGLANEYMSIYQYQPDNTGTVDDVTYNGTTEITLDLSAIIAVNGNVSISNNDQLFSIDLSNLLSVGGDFVVSDNGALLTIAVPNLATVGGDLVANSNTSVTSVDLSSLTTVDGAIDLSGDTALTTIDVDALTTAGNVTLSDDSSLVDVNVGALTTAGNVTINNDPSITTTDVGALTTAGNVTLSNDSSLIDVNVGALTAAGNVTLSDDSSLVDVNVGALTTAGNVTLSDDPSVTTIDVGALTTAGNVTISGDATLITLDLSALTQAGAIVIVDNGVVTLDLGALVSTGGDVSITDNGSLLTVDLPNLTDVTGDVTITSAADATLDASALGSGGGQVLLIGDNLTTTVNLGNLEHMTGLLTITSADGVTLTSQAGLAELAITGTASDDTLIGSATARNIMDGGDGNDNLTGGGSSDVITGGAHDDMLDGQGDDDTAVYSGLLGDYTIVQNADASLTIADIRAGAPDGTDTVVNFEHFQFADGTFALADVLPPPAITSDGGGDNAAVSVAENTTAVTDVTASDLNAAQTLAFSISGGADAAAFQIDAATGALAFKAAPDFEAPADAGADNVYDVIVQVFDGLNNDTQALAVTVTNVNEAPLANDDSYNVAENSSLIVPAAGVLGNDTDPENDPLSANLVSGPAHGDLAFNADGSFTYTPDADFSGDDAFSYQAGDGQLVSNVAAVHVTVSPAEITRTVYGNNHPNFFVDKSGFATTYWGLGGNDVALGRDGADALHGGDGNDALLGGTGNDRLYGGHDNDWLRGGAGDDLLVGGRGNDLLTGGPGADCFVFDCDNGHDLVTDFTPLVDHLKLVNGVTVKDVIPWQIDEGGTNNVTLELSSGSVTLLDVGPISDWHVLL